jgi:Fe-S-cluster-containing dehydrogenase component
MNKREFLRDLALSIPAVGMLQALARDAIAAAAEGPAADAAAAAPAAPAAPAAEAATEAAAYDPSQHWWGMGVDIHRCIGCNKCVEACKAENNVPQEPFYFRTWIERYSIKADGDVQVQCLSTQPPRGEDTPNVDPNVLRTFFVPKLCNQCAHPPCVQVCPVGATFQTEDGVVLVDSTYCIGCRYCIQACPYGARFLNPDTHTADKCTFCYHRITKGLQPACVEVCPTQARIFGDFKSEESRLARFERMNEVSVLKPDMNTQPKVRYAHLDGEVR